MSLQVSPVSRNLHNPVYFMGLEIEDMMIIGIVCIAALMGGQFLFPDRYLVFLPLNWALMLLVLILGVPSLSIFKYGKPRGYMKESVKRRQLDTLEALRKAVMQRAVTRGISENIALRTTGNAWMESVPQSWRLVCLKRIAEIQGGLTLGKQYEGVLIERPYLRVGNVQDGYLDLNDVSVIEVPESVAARVELRPDDVLMTEGAATSPKWKNERTSAPPTRSANNNIKPAVSQIRIFSTSAGGMSTLCRSYMWSWLR